MKSTCPNPPCHHLLTIWDFWTGGDNKNYYLCDNCGGWGPEYEVRQGVWIDRRDQKIIDAKEKKNL